MSDRPEKPQQEMINRLARVEGQLRGIQKLIREDADCELVIQQMSASRKALDKAYTEMLACIIEREVLQPQDGGTIDSGRLQQIRHLLTRYS
jgi:DNA-binding FrmR family transcriptional regulator